MDQPGNNSQYFGADNSYIDFTTFPFTLKRERKEVCTKKKKKKKKTSNRNRENISTTLEGQIYMSTSEEVL